MSDKKVVVGVVGAVDAPSNVKYKAAAATAATFLMVNGAQAADLAPPDLTPIVTLITGMVALVASVGMAVLSVYATGKVFKWVKAAF